jgi:hypothetical protein
MMRRIFFQIFGFDDLIGDISLTTASDDDFRALTLEVIEMIVVLTVLIKGRHYAWL